MTGDTCTTCPYCGVGCGIVARRQGGNRVSVEGDPAHPSNFGRLCSKGAALGETVDLDDRLLAPMVDGKVTGWDAALKKVADGFSNVIQEHGPEAVAFYVSGQLLTEDYYVANKLMKGFIGSANIDTNSRLCMSSSVAGHTRAFGSDTVPGCYQDLETADLVVLVGSNAAWCHPVLYQRIVAAKDSNPALTVVVIDPRRTATCDAADLHLALHPGSDAALFNGLLAYLHREGTTDPGFVARHTGGPEGALRAADPLANPVDVAHTCGLDTDDVVRFYQVFARTEKAVTLYSQGINQSSSGTDKVNAIINCHLITGRIGKPGMGPFSLTGQPNAMGGREVGGLATQLAAHMEIANPDHRALVQGFWRSPGMPERPGLKAVDLFDALNDGRIKALWIMATNPLVSLPDGNAARAALKKCPFVVVSDTTAQTDTAAGADVLLPALGWGEKDGTVTNSERRISRQRAFLPPPGEARPDWRIICDVAKHMGHGDGFTYTCAAEIFREHAALSGVENQGRRDFDISGLSAIDDAAYDALAPIQWPVTAERPGGTERLFSDGRFMTGDGAARFVAVEPRAPANPPDISFPLVLNTGRVRDHWHTLTRTGKSPRLSAHTTEPIAEIHPNDASGADVTDGALVRLSSDRGDMVARVRVTPDQRPGNVFVPMHWSDQFARQGRVNGLVNPVVDPVSGQPELKHTPVRVDPYPVKWRAFAMSRLTLAPAFADHWVRSAGNGYQHYDLAGLRLPSNWDLWARVLLGAGDGRTDWLAFSDANTGRYRYGLISEGRLEACVFVSVDGPLPSRAWLGGLFAKKQLLRAERASLLAARPAGQPADDSPVVCSCFGVSQNCLGDAIRKDGLTTAQQVGEALGAGTNCGSCLPEINRVLADTRHPLLAKSQREQVPA